MATPVQRSASRTTRLARSRTVRATDGERKGDGIVGSVVPTNTLLLAKEKPQLTRVAGWGFC
jgi:hypothetical protein